MNNQIEKSVAVVGSQAALARAIKKSCPFVNDMLHNRKRVPAELCLAIEKACGGQVTRFDLRPDVFGESPAKSKNRVA